MAELVRTVAGSDRSSLDKLHRALDLLGVYFQANPDFRRMLRHVFGGSVSAASAVASDAVEGGGQFAEVMDLVVGIIRDGQDAGEVRDGDPYALAHFYAVFVNEHVLLAESSESNSGALTMEQFHGLVDGALRKSVP
nr:hypothetical protein [Micromonospora sp. DSM 115978]